MNLANWTDQQITSQLDSGTSWNGVVFTYAFPTHVSGIDTSGGEAAGFSALNAAQRESATLAIAVWDSLISRTILRVVNGLSDIEFGLSNTGVEYAHAYYPEVGSVWFNSDYTELVLPAVGDYGFSTYIHETGHALGLNHAGDYNGSGGWSPLYFQDSTVYSIMSYFGPDHEDGSDLVAWGQWTDASGKLISPQTPMLNDVMAIQAIYGADTTTRLDDTIYGFASNITQNNLQSIYNFAINPNPILCIYDAGGVDTLNLTGWGTNSIIDLTPGGISSCNGMTSNLSIARNTLIENLITGTGNDHLSGNAVDNHLEAGAGNDWLVGDSGDDWLDGGDGFDTAQYGSEIGDYNFQCLTSGLVIKDQRINHDGLDTLTSIEELVFSDWSGAIQQHSAALSNATLSLKGQVTQYQVRGDNALAVVVDHVSGRDEVQLLTGYQRLRFSDLRIGLDTAEGENSGMAYRLYKAAFDRTPDLGGVGYWIHRIDNGLSLESSALEFINSPEFSGLYGANPTNAQFVTLLYEHVMHRTPEGEGFDFWVHALSPEGGWSRAGVLAYFSESDENLNQTAELVANGVQYLEYPA